MLHSFTDHPTDALLEQYAIGKLDEPDLGFVEEHLLVCEQCRDRLTEQDDFVRATRAAARQLRDVPLDFTHHTANGPILLLVRRAESGRWRASFAGQDLEGAQDFATVAEANAIDADNGTGAGRLFYTYVSGNHANSAAWWLLLRQLNEAERGPETRELAHAYAILGAGMTVMWPPLWRRGLRYTDRAAAINERLGDLWGKGNALNMRGLALHAAGRYEEAADVLGHADALFERPGDSWQRNAATWNRALSLYRLGDHQGAVDAAAQTADV